MLIWILLGAALAYSSGTIFQRVVLKEKKVNSKHFVVAVFSLAVLFMLPLLYWFGEFNPQVLELKNIILLAGIVFFAILANLLTFFSLKWEKINNLEPVRLLEPIFVVLLAFIFFESERNPHVLIPAIIASVTLVASHLKKHHLVFNKYAIAALLAGLCYAIDILLSKIILQYYNPLSLYFVRSFFIALFTIIIFRPNVFKEIGNKEKLITIIISATWIIYKVIAFFGYKTWGVIFTTLALLIAHVFIYIFAKIFLKEKILKRNIIAGIIIVLCVVYVNLRQFVF